MPDTREDELYRVAQLYYLQDETMESIAGRLGVSRSTVSRMLKSAREAGLVRISLAPGHSSQGPLGGRFRELFGVRAHVVAVRRSQPDPLRLDAVARVAARLLEEWVEPGAVVGVAWGRTVTAVVGHLSPTPRRGVRVVQLNGAANPSTTGIPYASSIISAIADAFDAESTYFPVPAFFDFAQTRAAMWRERSVQRVLAVQRRCDLALFGVGALGSPTSHVYAAGYLDQEEVRELTAQGAVGDVCTVMLREDGSFRDIAMNARATGPDPGELTRIPRRVCVVSGREKVVPAVAALRSGAVTDLVIDEETARAVLGRAEGHVVG